MNLHPYDNKERRFRHTDGNQREGLAVVARVLRAPTPPSPIGLVYDLSFFSGGIGVIDRFAISLPVDAATVPAWVERLDGLRPDEVAAASEEVQWLVDRQDDPMTPAAAALCAFIKEHRHAIQPNCDLADPTWVCRESGVNSWAVLWYHDGRLSYLAYDQG